MVAVDTAGGDDFDIFQSSKTRAPFLFQPREKIGVFRYNEPMSKGRLVVRRMSIDGRNDFIEFDLDHELALLQAAPPRQDREIVQAQAAYRNFFPRIVSRCGDRKKPFHKGAVGYEGGEAVRRKHHRGGKTLTLYAAQSIR